MIGETAPGPVLPAERRNYLADWLPHTMLAGFTASVTMMLAFLFSFGILGLLTNSHVLVPAKTTEIYGWLVALLNNRVIDLVAASFSMTGTLYLAGGMVFAFMYGAVVEPRRFAPGWLQGAIYAVIPWAISVAVFFPLVGGGFLGWGLGAGPLPAIGNLLLHLVYGVTLGAVYHALGQDRIRVRAAPRFRPTLQADRVAATCIGAGALIGAAVAVVGALVQSALRTGLALPLEELIFTALIYGAVFGAAVGATGSISHRRWS